MRVAGRQPLGRRINPTPLTSPAPAGLFLERLREGALIVWSLDSIPRLRLDREKPRADQNPRLPGAGLRLPTWRGLSFAPDRALIGSWVAALRTSSANAVRQTIYAGEDDSIDRLLKPLTIAPTIAPLRRSGGTHDESLHGTHFASPVPPEPTGRFIRQRTPNGSSIRPNT